LISISPVTTTTNEVPIKTNHVSQSSQVVLFDEAHCDLGSAAWNLGNASLFGWMLEEHGYETITNFNQQLDSGVLTGVDILVLAFPMVALTAAEITAVNNFVQAGGGLLLIGTDNNPTWQFTPINLNTLSQTYGITFSTNVDDGFFGTSTDLITHHLTQDVSSIHSNIDYKLKGTILSVSTPATTVVEYNDEPFVAVSEAGSGKVACVGALAPFLQVRRALHWLEEPDDHFQFSLNVVDWLAGVSPRKVNVRDIANITVGYGPALSPSELEEYGAYTGIIHDHTTHSDGADTPGEMLWASLSRGFDFFVMTDHSYENPNPIGLGGITGAIAMREIAERYGLNIDIFTGAELSRGLHAMAFPLTSNIYTSDESVKIAEAHAQGAMIALCHPTISAPYMEAYVNYDAWGYDAIEVTCDGFSSGLWDEGFTRNFYGASDGHSFESVGHIINTVFVDQPTGPDGRLSDYDIMDAILDKRVVVFDRVSNIVYGQKIWLDRYLELMDQAETEIVNAEAIIEAVDPEGLTLASKYLEFGKTALTRWSPQNAICSAANATTGEALNITIDVISPASPRFLYPDTTHDLTLNISSTSADTIQFNMTQYLVLGVSVGPSDDTAVLPAGGSLNWTVEITTPSVGYCAYVLNIHDFNTTSSLCPLVYGTGILTNVGAHFEPERTVDGTYVTVQFAIERGDSRFLTPAIGFYDDGSGEQNVTISITTNTLEGTIGPYLRGTVIDIRAVFYDIFGGVFESPVLEYTVTTDPLEPTTSTTPTTGNGTPLQIDPLLILGITGGVIVVIVIVVFLNKRKGGV
jgi:hypothetical protein